MVGAHDVTQGADGTGDQRRRRVGDVAQVATAADQNDACTEEEDTLS